LAACYPVFTVAAESFSERLLARRLQTALDSLSLFSKGGKLKVYCDY